MELDKVDVETFVVELDVDVIELVVDVDADSELVLELIVLAEDDTGELDEDVLILDVADELDGVT